MRDLARRAQTTGGHAGGSCWQMAQRSPRPDLRPYIRNYCGYSETAPGAVRRLEFPGPQIAVVIEFGPPVRVFDSGQRRLASRFPGGFVAGIDDQFSLVEHEGHQRGVQLNLTPLGGRLFFGIPMSHLAGRVVSLTDLLDLAHRHLADRLESLPDWDARFDLLEELVTARLDRAVPQSPAVAWAYQRIQRSSRAPDIRALCREIGYSQKHLISLFRDHVGVPPKLLSRIVRFDRLMGYLKRGGDGTWAELALRFGYYDQSHLVRDARQFTGTTPTLARAMLLNVSEPAACLEPAHR